jgi:hypothetical protein
MRRRVLILLVLGLLGTACDSTLGRDIPECEIDNAGNTLVLEVQSVPQAAFVACVAGLKPGWDYQHAQIESGRSVFWLDSDRMGEPFITVEVVGSCDPGDAAPAESRYPGIALFKDVHKETTVAVVLVPEQPSEATTARAVEILNTLGDVEIRDRIVVATVSASDTPTGDRIRRAASSGAHVIVISIRDAEEGTLTLQLAGQNQEVKVDDLDDVIDEIEDVETKPSYTGNWYYVFEGGCVVYTFDAEGPDVNTIERDIQRALGLFDAEELREFARDLGYDI